MRQYAVIFGGHGEPQALFRAFVVAKGVVMNLKQRIVELGFALAAAGLLSVQAHAADADAARDERTERAVPADAAAQPGAAPAASRAPRYPPQTGPEGVLLATHSMAGRVSVRSWKTLRDEGIVKQDLDYSCGAASLATLLNAFYGQNVTEKQLLDAMDIGDGRASFADMARALPQFGFRAQGFAASWEQLTQLRMPVVVYVEHRRVEHFSVLRGISGNTVWLADPSLGNRTYSREQFLAMWQTRRNPANAEQEGKFLAVLPATAEARVQGDYFTRTPRRQSANAVAALAFRALP